MTSVMDSSLSIFSRVTFLLALLLLSSCGSRTDGPARFDLTGEITYDGKPVPAGDILFEPDTSQGNEGPAGIGVIDNGRYKTLPGKGTVGGPHIVRIFSYDGLNRSEPSPNGQQLFPQQTISMDLPRAASAKHNIALEMPPSTEMKKP